MKRLFVLICCAVTVLAVLAPIASAGPTSAYDEPSFTKTSGNNSFWFHWNKRQSYDGNGTAFDSYYLCFSTYQNGVLVEGHSGGNGPGSSGCTGNLSGSSGDYGVVPFAANTVLQEGSSYYMCVVGYFANFTYWASDTPSACTTATTIDRSNPSATVYTNGTDDYTNVATLHHRIDYSDAISPAWLGQASHAANYRCIKLGSPCTGSDTFTYDPNCSVITMPRSGKTNQFFCDVNMSAQSDGTWYFCAKAADAAIPDNTAGTNQFNYANGQPVNSDTANISAASCGSIILDRAAPTVTATADDTSVTVGQLVTFTGSASDGGSGVAASGFTWTFGDNTAGGTGISPTHTYTQPGQYVAQATRSDKAGNSGNGTVTINVVAAPPCDSDGDGLPNSSDVCPNVSDAGAHRSPRNGCPADPPPLDSDGDGLPNSSDACPTESDVGAQRNPRTGCPLPVDSDGDGLPNSSDACPSQSDLAAPRDPRTGCPAATAPADSDSDGVADSLDACPTQSDLAHPRNPRTGCPVPVDTDGDGLVDSADACPAKSDAGLHRSPRTGCPRPAGPRPTSGNDVLNGNGLANVICGLLGNDTINGLGGNDTLWGDACNDKRKTVFGAAAASDGNDKLDGGDGNDTLYGAGGKDVLNGKKGKDKLFGGGANDTLIGGPGVNTYKGGGGNDTLNARNGKKETVDCGGGKKDKANVDKSDTVKGCETVTRPN